MNIRVVTSCGIEVGLPRVWARGLGDLLEEQVQHCEVPSLSMPVTLSTVVNLLSGVIDEEVVDMKTLLGIFVQLHPSDNQPPGSILGEAMSHDKTIIDLASESTQKIANERPTNVPSKSYSNSSEIKAGEDILRCSFLTQSFERKPLLEGEVARVQIIDIGDENKGVIPLRLNDGIHTTWKVATNETKTNEKILNIKKMSQNCTIEIKSAYINKKGIILVKDFDIVQFNGTTKLQATYVKGLREVTKEKRVKCNNKNTTDKTTLVYPLYNKK